MNERRVRRSVSVRGGGGNRTEGGIMEDGRKRGNGRKAEAGIGIKAYGNGATSNVCHSKL